MIARIIDLCAGNRFLVFVLLLLGIAGGFHALKSTPLDAIPDLSDVQVIVSTDWEGRSPDLVEDQLTYPISTKFIAAPGVKSVRGESMFGKSFVYIIFEDGTDIYWARSRVLEYLNSVRGSLPEGVNPVIGPDATGIGWVYEYALVDDSGTHDLAELRSLQDWRLRYALESVKGVAEVAPVGGFVKAYQIDLDPNALAAFHIPLADVVNRVKMSNGDVGGRTFEVATTEYYVRGRGYIHSIADIENIVLKVERGTPVLVKNVGAVHLGGDLRRGVAELDGKGETVGGIVVMRHGENALAVIDGIKRKLAEIQPSLPPGVRVVPAYDRSDLIRRAIATLREKLIEESIVVALVCLVFLWHVRSALVAIITLPVAILLSFLPMRWLGLTSNIMSLGGIAIAIGAMVDAAIIMVENAHKHLERLQNAPGASSRPRIPAQFSGNAAQPGVSVVHSAGFHDSSAASGDQSAASHDQSAASDDRFADLLSSSSDFHTQGEFPHLAVADFKAQSAGFDIKSSSELSRTSGADDSFAAKLRSFFAKPRGVPAKPRGLPGEGEAKTGATQPPAHGSAGQRAQAILLAAKEVGRPLFFSLLVITVSFLPVFSLTGQEGRLFKPLAFTKTFSMFFAAVLGITLVPVLMTLLIRGRITPEARNPVNRLLVRAYHPLAGWVLRHRRLTLAGAALLMAATVFPFLRLGSEFMPPLNEGTLLYMPTAQPGLSIGEATRILQIQDRLLRTVPEVERVFGKAGQAGTPTDPAPLSMFETVVTFKPPERWRAGMTWEKLLAEIHGRVQTPGMANQMQMPIQTRTEMLSTGLRTPVGIKVFGPDLAGIEDAAGQIATALGDFPDTRSVFAERTTGGYFLDFTVNREAAARYGLTVGEVNDVIETAIGGKTVTTTVEGRERYPVSVRYAPDFRQDLDALKRVLVPTPGGAQVPVSLLADIAFKTGPPSIRNENGQLVGFVFVDVTTGDIEGYVRRAGARLRERVHFPPGCYVQWAGQFEYLQAAKARLRVVVPFTLLIIFVLLYVNTGSVVKTCIVLLAVPFSLVGAFWLLWLLGYNMSVAVWVGLIALAGLDAETGVVMLLYLDHAWEKFRAEGRMNTMRDLHDAVIEGAVQRIRPKVMTVCAILFGLLPIMWSPVTQAGADVMKRIATPMIGGVLTSAVLELLLYPVIFVLWKKRGLRVAG